MTRHAVFVILIEFLKHFVGARNINDSGCVEQHFNTACITQNLKDSKE